ncbi:MULTISPECIES: type VI secretion system lipoprotein TssJ [unclassified Xenorhabdus]|nr:MULTISPECIES: type VI secretion system lipoprotein TssJ [unclassified Xenorhabdus]MCC8378252.1 type VI secretion system lipoprotein TssJ [Xenorhabdus sp. PB30.3]
MAKRILLTFLLIMAGCSSQQPEKLPPYQLVFNIAPNVNDSAPLKIDVMLLKSKEEFMSADFFSLQGNAKAALGDKLVNEDRFFILPTEHVRHLLEQNQPEIHYIGIVAEYRQLDGKKWRIALPVSVPAKPPFYKFWRSAPDKLQVCIKVTGSGLTPDLTCAA